MEMKPKLSRVLSKHITIGELAVSGENADEI
jgi:hypothetical protein